MKATWRRGIFYFLIIIMIFTSVQDSQAKTIYGEQTDEVFPLLQIIKTRSTDETRLGNNITVNVNITNWSNEPAFNLSITEPLFSDWAYSYFAGFDEYTYLQVDAQASFSYGYNMTLKAEGKYTIEATEIEYVDVNGTMYHSRSQVIPITIFVINPPISLSQKWRNILYMSVIIIAVPLILYFINSKLWRQD
ncbi:MAG: hypothetical protein ACW99A_11810 [Candidatus Kariarchaeaceae archaeon]